MNWLLKFKTTEAYFQSYSTKIRKYKYQNRKITVPEPESPCTRIWKPQYQNQKVNVPESKNYNTTYWYKKKLVVVTNKAQYNEFYILFKFCILFKFGMYQEHAVV